MHSETFSCTVCQLAYNRTTRLPKSITSCGHTICLQCLTQVLTTQNPPKCPIDSSIIDITTQKVGTSFPTNIILLQLFDEKPKSEYESCATHNEPCDHVCFTDKQKICKYCAKYGGHRNHKVKHIKKIQEEINLRKNYLESLIMNFEGDIKPPHDSLVNEKNGLLKLLEQNFLRIKENLAKKEEEIESEIELFFLQEKLAVDDQLSKDFSSRREIESKLFDLMDDNMGSGFFQSLQYENNVKTDPNIYEQTIMKGPDKVRNEYESALEKLGTSFFIAIEKFNPIFPPKEAIQAKENHKIMNVINLLSLIEEDDWLVISVRDSYKQKESDEDKEIDLKKIKDMNKIKLEFNKRVLTETAVQVLLYIWEELGPVTHMKMDLSNKGLNDRDLWALCENNFWAHEKIESFELNLGGCNAKDESVTKIIKKIACMTRLKVLKLNLKNTKISDRTIEAFVSDVMPTLCDLNTFQLYLSGTGVTDTSIEKMYRKMKDVFNNVKTYALDLRKTKITFASIDVFRIQALPSLNHLESLMLGLFDTQVNDSSMEQLFVAMKRTVAKAKTLTLNLTNTKVADKSVEAFAKTCLLKMTSLENFTLNLSDTQVTDLSIRCLFENMKNAVKNVKCFTLTLNNTKITDKAIEVLAKQTLPNMTCLEAFVLGLYGTQISNASVELLCLNLEPNIQKIKKFNLGLINTRITDKGLDLFAKTSLPLMTSIENLTLGLLGTQVTDASVAVLFANLRSQMKNIKSLILELGNTRITNRSIETLTIQAVPFMTSIESLTLGLSATQVNDTSILPLCENMRNYVKTLKEFTLALGHTQVTDKSAGALVNSIFSCMDTIVSFEIDLDNTKVTTSGRRQIVDLHESIMSK